MGAPKGTRPPNAGKGRPKGVPNKVNGDLKEMILGALAAAGGEEYLKRQAKDNSSAFLALVGRVLPKQIDANLTGALGNYQAVPVPVEEREPLPRASNGHNKTS